VWPSPSPSPPPRRNLQSAPGPWRGTRSLSTTGILTRHEIPVGIRNTPSFLGGCWRGPIVGAGTGAKGKRGMLLVYGTTRQRYGTDTAAGGGGDPRGAAPRPARRGPRGPGPRRRREAPRGCGSTGERRRRCTPGGRGWPGRRREGGMRTTARSEEKGSPGRLLVERNRRSPPAAGPRGHRHLARADTIAGGGWAGMLCSDPSWVTVYGVAAQFPGTKKSETRNEGRVTSLILP